MEWQTIDTAPKNPQGECSGPFVLIWNEYNHSIHLARWTYEGEAEGWTPKTPLVGMISFPKHHITHWMQRPVNPPKESLQQRCVEADDDLTKPT